MKVLRSSAAKLDRLAGLVASGMDVAAAMMAVEAADEQ